MRISEKLALMDKIGRELQSRFGYAEIDAFFAEFGVPPPKDVVENSKWVYSKAALRGVSEQAVLRIAEELELIVPGIAGRSLSPPRNWKDTKLFRLFMSHISKDKVKATRLKDCLASYGISGFVAHEDIHPPWNGRAKLSEPFRPWMVLLPFTRPASQIASGHSRKSASL